MATLVVAGTYDLGLRRKICTKEYRDRLARRIENEYNIGKNSYSLQHFNQ